MASLSDADYDSLFTKDKHIIFNFHGYPTLVHRLTYRSTNQNLHVRGYKEEGTITTAFDMRVQNDMDRFHLVQDSLQMALLKPRRQKRLTQYGPNEIEEKKTNPFLKFLTYFWGPIPWMIEIAVILSGVVRHWPDFFIILLLLFANASGRILGRTPGWQCHCCPESQACDQGSSETRWKVEHPAARELVPGDVIRLRSGRYCAGGCALVRGRSGRGRSVCADGRIIASRREIWRAGVFRIDYSAGRNRRAGLCHG
jgi:magnesium-transporting ATPase (P-type)